MTHHPIRGLFLTALIASAVTVVLLRWDLVPGLNKTPIPYPPTKAAAALPGQPPLSAEEQTSIGVYNNVSPGVVNITSTVVEFDFFFAPFQTEGATGSGSVLDDKGNILTNYHVIQNARNLEVALPDRTKYRATVVGYDPVNDLGVIRISAPKERLRPVPLGDSTGLKVGQKVLAIGNPFRLQNTLTTGIISSLGRTIQSPGGDLINNIIQTDAAINPGSSGGPLLNTAGELIGVNTLIFTTTRGGGNIGIGFAVPVSTVRRVVTDILEYGRVLRPWPGFDGYAITEELSSALDLPVREGVLVARVYRGSSAEKADIRGATEIAVLFNERIMVGGDVITHIDGKPISSTEELRLALEGKRPGDTVQITLFRGRTKMTKEMVLAEHPRQRSLRF
jgi:putative serine protease PepD